MGISLLLAGGQLRRQWRGLLSLSLLVALVGGLVLGGVVGAERTRTAVDRMIVDTDSADILVNPDEGDESALDYAKVAALPMVADFSRVHGVMVVPTEPIHAIAELFSGPQVVTSDGGAVFRFERPRLIDGRVPGPDSLDEVYLDRAEASRLGVGVNDWITWRVLSPQVLETARPAMEADDVEAALDILNDPKVGSIVRLRVAGIGNWLDSVAVDEGFEPPAAWIGPALYESLGAPTAGYGGAAVRLRDPADVPAFRAAVDVLVPDEKVVYQTLRVKRTRALRATQPAATALAIFTAVTALLGLLLIGQAMSRRLQLDARDNRTLAALGTTRRERFGASMIRLTAAVVAGTLLGVVLAVLASLFTPVGPARLAETDPGLWLDVRLLITGAALLMAAVIAVGIVPAWRRAGHLDPTSVAPGSSVAAWAAHHGASPSVTTGLRFALEKGRGDTAVPARATIAAAITAITVAAATIVFAASLDHVVSDGRFYGSNFDLAIDFIGPVASDDAGMQSVLSTVAGDPAVRRSTELRISEILVNDQPVTAISFESNANPVSPTIAAGRSPIHRDEIALGASTLRELGVSVGDRVSVVTSGFRDDARVVGRAVLPGVGLYEGADRTATGTGAVVPFASLGPRDGATRSYVVVVLDGAADRSAFEGRLGQALAPYAPVIHWDSRPSDMQSLSRLRSLPEVLAALLIVLVAVTVLHAMVAAVRRRRRDLAVLQALGATRHAVMTIGAWQGITIGVAGLAIGVPLGIVLGRTLWTLLANAYGTLAEPIVPVTGVVTLVATVLLLAGTTGVIPIRRGLRQRPAEVLRTE